MKAILLTMKPSVQAGIEHGLVIPPKPKRNWWPGHPVLTPEQARDKQRQHVQNYQKPIRAARYAVGLTARGTQRIYKLTNQPKP